MAVIQRQLPLQMARLRRIQVPTRYVKLRESGVIVGAVVIVCLLSILFLAQTGRVATAGYRLQELEREHELLVQEAELYEFRIAQASKLDVINERAQKLGMRPATIEQLRYTTVHVPSVPVVANNK